MQNKKSISLLLILSICSFFIMSADFLIMPIGNSFADQNMKWFDILTGTIFWGFLISGIVLFVLFSKKCRKYMINSDGNNYKKKAIGILSFFSNRYAIVSDICLIFSIVFFVTLMIFTNRTSYICYISIMLFAFFISMHCILNGKYFNYLLKNQEVEKNEKEIR